MYETIQPPVLFVTRNTHIARTFTAVRAPPKELCSFKWRSEGRQTHVGFTPHRPGMAVTLAGGGQLLLCSRCLSLLPPTHHPPTAPIPLATQLFSMPAPASPTRVLPAPVNASAVFRHHIFLKWIYDRTLPIVHSQKQ
ncbi:hypothetical protein E2C01_002952 [Portunus trituberculatus]|uniref:Uncharacterized protein n=1 Tax=Portunus trituberculatus TaxID=210409 RepID=A0A5B7CMP0_PORTR|nr:hypothetical protein [Portunus trituberculatus]